MENENTYASMPFIQYFLNDSNLWCIALSYRTYCTSVLSVFSPFSISSVGHCSSNKPLKFYKEKLYGFCAGLYDSSVRCYARYSGAISPTQFSVDNSAFKTPEVVERLVFGCMWDYHICQHTFLKTTTSSSSLMFCLTSYLIRSIS